MAVYYYAKKIRQSNSSHVINPPVSVSSKEGQTTASSLVPAAPSVITKVWISGYLPSVDRYTIYIDEYALNILSLVLRK